MDEKARTDSMFTRECFKYGDTMIINMIIKKQIETNENGGEEIKNLKISQS